MSKLTPRNMWTMANVMADKRRGTGSGKHRAREKDARGVKRPWHRYGHAWWRSRPMRGT